MIANRKSQVAVAIDAIREFRRIGLQVLERSQGGVYGRRVVETMEEELGINQDTLRKARIVADEEKGYSRTALEKLCRLIREHQVSGEGAIFGPTHLNRLLRVPKRDRDAFQAMAVKKRWSIDRLEAEIARRYGRRRAGGRKRRVAVDATLFLTQLDSMCVSWLRWREIVFPSPQKADDRATPDRQEQVRARKRLNSLPSDLVQLIAESCKAVERLHARVRAELPTREASTSHRSRS
jgi:hypothetical protein